MLNSLTDPREIRDELRSQGVALTHLPTADAPTIVRFCQQFGTIRPHRDADRDGITRIRRVDAVSNDATYKAFGEGELLPHTDGSSVPAPPNLVIQYCVRPAQLGGATLLVDASTVWTRLTKTRPYLADVLAKPNTVWFGLGPSAYLGSIFTVINGRPEVRFRYDDQGYYSKEVALALPYLMEVIYSEAITVNLAASDLILIDNKRWLHGRTTFSGPRELWRTLVDSQHSQQLPDA